MMTRDETIKLLMIIQSFYPNFNVENKGATANAWHMVLKDYPYELAEQGLLQFFRDDKKGFAPVPGQIIDKMQKFTDPEYLDESEAWSLVSKALRNGIYHSVEEYARLPEIVQKAVGTHEQLRNWAMEEDFNEDVARAGFVRVYRQEIERDKEYRKMPENVRNLIDKTNEDSDRKMIEDYRRKKEQENTDKKEKIEGKKEFVPMPERAKKKLQEVIDQ